ncbi:MAG: divalent-cation tolerance protein CutA [Chromatiales bacterium]|jgi:periplasmic divalent cation tolerance protein|nr:divalent-cation tolerance protein CutA [Chromatiales bacterium]MDP6151431.1 divalent-cation tolerance protein CutA [Gammaproteobacteria bacterium]MDP7094537.1 divalent-cation tolerance protein CutA [Gammaproteobacteria bacterium]MDP7270311.1 divalent-cation tolerance protein CutA [Gammaproteobacteria bacterium]HJP05251.1 divalent-cation tolerance protein CutA [Gammaproteobacteria bacterium]
MSEENLLVLCTCPDKEVAESLATGLVEAGLAACVNRVPGVVSIYKWQDKLEKDAEELLLIKTTADAWDKLEAEIRRLHPYELPEIIAVPISAGSHKYLNWIRETTR